MNNNSDGESSNVSKAMVPRSGYDLPVYGLDNGSFYYLHVPALSCIVGSLCCVIIVLTLSFRRNSFRTFFDWTKSDRFIVYLAICDGGFNIFHGIDHVQYVISKKHIRPQQLCEFYAFTLTVFMTAQTLMVNIVAINAFMLMYLRKNLDFGRKDWRLWTWTFGAPFVGATIAAFTGQFGPCGSFCHFDPIKGGTAYIFFTTVPLVIVMVVNSIMYVLTWRRIKAQTSRLANMQNLHTVNKSQRAAKTMTMFVVAFFIQWSALTVFSVWVLITPIIPQAMLHIVTIFTNLGGCLNLCVYIIIRRRSMAGSDERTVESIKLSNISSQEMRMKSRDPDRGFQHTAVSPSNSSIVINTI